MSPLIAIPFFLSLTFAAFYPLFVWVDPKGVFPKSFYRFHIIFPAFFLFFSTLLANVYNLFSLFYLLLWIYQIIIVTTLLWKRDGVNPTIISLPSLWGLYVVFLVQNLIFNIGTAQTILLFLNSIVFASLCYAAVLGHWYLNIKGLSLSFLKRSVKLYLFFMTIRIVLSFFFFLKQNIVYRGDLYSFWDFIQKFEGFFLGFSCFLTHIVSPILGLMILKVLSYKNTQSATGLLYVNFGFLLMAQLFSYHYLLKYQILF